MNLDEWCERAAKAAYEVWRTRNDRVVWDALEPRAQSLWLDIAHAVLGEGRIEFRQSAELAEHLTREENVRLVRIAREWAETAANYREAAERNLADFRTVSAQLEVLREALALGEASDGHHTHNELYSFRLLYNVHAALAFDHAGWTVVRSWKHSDGKPCFDSPDWFVVHMETPAGQITNHYKRHYWRHFDGIAEVPTAPEWDGHTSEVAALRLEAAIEFLRGAFDVQRQYRSFLKDRLAAFEIADNDRVRACTGCANGCTGCTGNMRAAGAPMRDDS